MENLIEKIIKNLERNLSLYTFILTLISIIYINERSIFYLGSKFTTSVAGLLAFIGIFYGVIIFSEFFEKLKTITINEINRVKKEIDNLNKKETNSKDYERNIEYSNKKIELYNDLLNIKKNRKISKFLFISTSLLILILIIDSNFISNILFGINNYKPYILTILFWTAIYNIFRIILIFYRTYSD